MNALLDPFRILTVLPVPPSERPPTAWSAAMLPLAGFFVGLAWVFGAGSLRLFPRTTAIAAAMILIIDAVLTGARHLQGLADAVDEIGAAADPTGGARPGVGGVVAVNLVLLVRFAVLIWAVEFGAGLLVVPIIGRAALLVLVAQLPGRILGLPSPRLPVVGVGLLLAAAGAWLGGPRALLALAVALAVTVVLGVAAEELVRRRGAPTADAAAWGGSLVAETVALLMLVAPIV